MAKQLVNPIERHVDKGVLAIAALVLIAAVARYLVTSPNQIELGGEFVTPASIDQKVGQQASSVRSRMLSAPVPTRTADPLYPEFVASLKLLEGSDLMDTLPAGVSMRPEIPIVKMAVAIGDAQLVEVVPPRSPKILSGRSVIESPGTGRQVDTNWVTVAVEFDVKAQRAVQGEQYGAARKEVSFGPLDAQRRSRRPDGSWSDDDWAPFESWPAGSMPQLPDIQLEQDRDRVIVSRSTTADVDSFRTRLSGPEVQLDLIRPLMPAQLTPDYWDINEIAPQRDVGIQDDYYLKREVPPSGEPTLRYTQAGDGDGTLDAATKSPSEILDAVELTIEAAWNAKSEEQATEAFNAAITIEDDTTAPSGIRDRAKKLRVDANRILADIKRHIKRFGTGKILGNDPDDIFYREPEPKQILWVHDAKPGSLASGETYQYRVRPVIYNRLAGEPEQFRNKADATVVMIPGAWMDPIEITIRPDTTYFTTSSDRNKQMVSVELFKWYEGVWVKSRFKYGVGDVVRGNERHDHPDMENPGEIENTRVDFAADATVVDIDLDRAYRERKRAASRDGIRFADRQGSCCVVFVDSAGRLHERWVEADKGSPDKRLYTDLLWRARGDN